MVIFGGVLNFGKMGFLARKTVGQLWRKFEEVGFGKKEGIYDTRDWKTIQNWTKELAKKFQSYYFVFMHDIFAFTPLKIGVNSNKNLVFTVY